MSNSVRKMKQYPTQSSSYDLVLQLVHVPDEDFVPQDDAFWVIGICLTGLII
jgi:hypothetical protein